MGIIFKLLQTPKQCYVYDRGRDAIIKITKEEFDELMEVQNKKIKPEDSKVIKKYQKNEYLMEDTLEKIEHPYSNALEHYYKHHMEQLILQVTQRCNLRCSYCVYSGNYNNRVHSNLVMSEEIAFRAIDLYLAASEEVEEVRVAFYGGEPLLKFDLIKKCVDYVKEKSKGKNVEFFMTTNAILLQNEIAKYMNDNNFHITISLDGPKEEHNKYRKFPDGSGSFDYMMNNIQKIKENYPHLYKNLAFNMVVNPEHDFEKLTTFFSKDQLIGKLPVTLALVEPTEAGKVIEDGYAQEFTYIRSFDYLRLLLNMIGKLNDSFVSKFVYGNKYRIISRYEQIRKTTFIGKQNHPSGPCVPGSRRVFVNAIGNIYPCERVSETCSAMKLGNVNEGFDLEKVQAILNVGKLTEEKCKNCWAFFHCNLCARKAYTEQGLSGEHKCLSCAQSKDSAYTDIKEICVLKELGCTFQM